MNEDGLKLTTYFGERDRVDGGFARRRAHRRLRPPRARASLLLRGVEGFGLKQHVRTDRLLSLSEDLPLVSVAVDTRPRIEAALEDVGTMPFTGLVTLERARIVRGAPARSSCPRTRRGDQAHGVRRAPASGGGRRPVHEAVVACCTARRGRGDRAARRRRHGARPPGARALLRPQRARPGDDHRRRGGRAIASALPELEALLRRPLLTLERVRVCKRDGVMLAEPREVPGTDPSGLRHVAEAHGLRGRAVAPRGAPLYGRARPGAARAGAAGATSLRGIWGYHGDHAPHGDTSGSCAAASRSSPSSSTPRTGSGAGSPSSTRSRTRPGW